MQNLAGEGTAIDAALGDRGAREQARNSKNQQL
jgi:hypothetical protein